MEFQRVVATLHSHANRIAGVSDRRTRLGLEQGQIRIEIRDRPVFNMNHNVPFAQGDLVPVVFDLAVNLQATVAEIHDHSEPAGRGRPRPGPKRDHARPRRLARNECGDQGAWSDALVLAPVSLGQVVSVEEMNAESQIASDEEEDPISHNVSHILPPQ